MKLVGVMGAAVFPVILAMAAAGFAEQRQGQNKEKKVSAETAKQHQTTRNIAPPHELPHQPQPDIQGARPEKAAGQPREHSNRGGRDLQPAHELTHTVQQKGAAKTQPPDQNEAGQVPK